ncbi:c-type cytochrome [Falsirhodobacter deserti]|uniref:c-type cytochrome n=1 Tax=Falsirhodobacter deserti TaxID=1365611 RepID=UPI000FE2D770|nr:cytochrome c family protein [Falsirhodobacter deserti]
MGGLTRLIAAGAGVLLVLACLNWAATEIYAPRSVPLAYAIVEVEEPEEPAPAPPPEAAPADAPAPVVVDAEAGRTVFARCSACHRLDGSNGVGPHLDGVVGRQKASLPDFNYSSALRAMADEAWTPEKLDAFLANPRGYAPGTRMAFAGLPNAQDRADVIAFLAQPH